MPHDPALPLPDLFPDHPAAAEDITILVETAVTLLADLLASEVLAVAWSGGKDSTACVILALLAMQRAAALGLDPAPLVILHGDTLVESPPVRALADEMLEALRTWCGETGIPLVPIVYTPALNQSYAVKILSGTALPTFPESRRRICSASWKVEPAGRALERDAASAIIALSSGTGRRWRQVEAALDPRSTPRWSTQPIVVLGSRLDESARRALSMQKHRQHRGVVTVEDAGRRTISPIASWSEMDVWELLGLAGTSTPAFRVWQDDFSELVQLYRGAAGGCVIVPGRRAAGKACGARFGCHACQAVQADESAAALVEDPRWSYAAPLLRIRDYIAAIRHDLSRRSWLDCTEDPAGFIKVYPGPFAGETVRELARFYMTADRLEAERAYRFRLAVEAGVDPDDPYVAACRAAGLAPDRRYLERMQRPQFRTFDHRTAIACDLYASLRGHQARPFGILQAWHEVWHQRRLAFPPAIAPASPMPLPEPRWIAVPWLDPGYAQDLLAVAVTELCPFEPDHVGGTPMMPQGLDATFDVDPEAAWFIVEEEYPNHLRRQHDDPVAGPFAGINYYLNVGCLTLSPQGRHSLMARLARMERWWQMGLVGASHDTLLARSMSDAEYRARGGTLSTGSRQLALFS